MWRNNKINNWTKEKGCNICLVFSFNCSTKWCRRVSMTTVSICLFVCFSIESLYLSLLVVRPSHYYKYIYRTNSKRWNFSYIKYPSLVLLEKRFVWDINFIKETNCYRFCSSFTVTKKCPPPKPCQHRKLHKAEIVLNNCNMKSTNMK